VVGCKYEMLSPSAPALRAWPLTSPQPTAMLTVTGFEKLFSKKLTTEVMAAVKPTGALATLAS
jgi:hypothetical protein